MLRRKIYLFDVNMTPQSLPSIAAIERVFSIGRVVLTLFYTRYLTNGILHGGTKKLPQLNKNWI